MTNNLIPHLEHLSFRAWCALETIDYDGWVLRFADGYTRRANSINPINGSTLDVHEKIAHCEQIYRERNQPVVFKMTNAVYPSNLDAILAEKGYQHDAETAVYVHDNLMRLNTTMSPLAQYKQHITDKWIDDFVYLNVVDSRRIAIMREILSKIEGETCFMRLREDGFTVAVGIGVCDGDYLGFYDIVTSIDKRRSGYGTALMTSLIQWGKEIGATKGYLQVMTDNPPALNLYRKLGFTERYRYWYRTTD